MTRPYTRYKECNLIERFFYKLKQFRRVATCYDKLLVNYEGFINSPPSQSCSGEVVTTA